MVAGDAMKLGPRTLSTTRVLGIVTVVPCGGTNAQQGVSSLVGKTCFGSWVVPSPRGNDADYGAVRLVFVASPNASSGVAVRIGSERGLAARKRRATHRGSLKM